MAGVGRWLHLSDKTTTTAIWPGLGLTLSGPCSQPSTARSVISRTQLQLVVSKHRPNSTGPAIALPRVSTSDCPACIVESPPARQLNTYTPDLRHSNTSEFKSRTRLRGRLGILGGTCPTEWIFSRTVDPVPGIHSD
ncbi:hypothetical protein BO86DRAFT_143906 [Aspergillus japonicus CBS 114.51]|uniref:Uncharacterized protein n=1 Tax=Aspergillus japonicus CBS 114.51 TaxID=1448312 RepID=A0A8T8WXA9_ASPJA|nr:hypothetical protein BO86DRAFT_143906 [Aspergillus japonicus CBS 114.51]RAH79929.1 hypothetical protein BO86DRAFT_143906 [Aspergillus japonicus CBS 114.51]